MTWQKNVNHFNSANPGNFTVLYEDTANSSEPVALLVVPDDNSPSLTLYTFDVVIPLQITSSATISLAYISNTAPTYYSCSDFSVYTP